ncbi:hypothetical protein H0A36_22900 [Endozoicomonas sp. SM1973]|uniref:Uncharacterized protein n=1 Tax=Spartinivicinus marinus TaxID=2994442 RepID=A0A853IAN2_9GAMM|nr:hypothetical protein [Spartinivicinus marinus]MCX4027496.1 hypothetical protein [Spartinivicinus marinus]NYZ68872.1 hypothetical protein [Spartinivicinus marinus]
MKKVLVIIALISATWVFFNKSGGLSNIATGEVTLGPGVYARAIPKQEKIRN